MINILKISLLDYMFSMLLTCFTKVCANWMLFTIQSRNASFMHSFKYKNFKILYLIYDIVIDLR